MSIRNSALVAYCGLYCGDCVVKKSKVADQSKALLKEIRKGRFDKIGPRLAKVLDAFKPLRNIEQCCACLSALSHLWCAKTCREGGGTTSCRIRICCRARHLEGCWECDEYVHCDKLAWLEPVNGDAHLRNIRKIRRQGMNRFLRGKKYW